MIKNFIAGGCSFTASGVGGMPPTNEYDGNSSFTRYDNNKTSAPIMWPDFLSRDKQFSSYVNVASASHGNTQTSHNILYLLDNFNYTPGDTLIIFNLTEFGRADLFCDSDNTAKSKFVSWSSNNTMPYSLIDIDTTEYKKTMKMLGRENTELLSYQSLLFLASVLSYNKFNWYFLTMRDYSNYALAMKFINKFKKHYIPCGSDNGMHEYAKRKNLLRSDGFHPTVEGHNEIFNIVKNEII